MQEEAKAVDTVTGQMPGSVWERARPCSSGQQDNPGHDRLAGTHGRGFSFCYTTACTLPRSTTLPALTLTDFVCKTLKPVGKGAWFTSFCLPPDVTVRRFLMLALLHTYCYHRTMKLIQTPVEEIYVRALRVAAAKRGIKPTDLAREIFSRALIKEVTDLKLEAEGNNGHQS